MKWFFVLALSVGIEARAAHIAVIDSGLDYKHTALAGQIWLNTAEVADGRDNDNNGYQDDFWGWNFAGNSNQVINYKYLGTFSADCTKFFEVQGRLLLGTGTEDDKTWYTTKIKDKKFVAELGKFGNFVHGTHVAGITVKNSASQVMGIKIIPTEVGESLAKLAENTKSLVNEDFRMTALKSVLRSLAQQQMAMLEEVALYVNSRGADVANGSFGTGFEQAKTITSTAFKIAFFRDATAAESEMITRYFLDQMIAFGQKMVKAAPKTLFVFAAGNDNSNNDVYPTSPTNVRADNVISVAATYDVQFLAPFSNYGAKLVDVAAPGMLIKSTIPGNGFLQVSGTSQASPFVANIAAQIKDANPELSPADIKRVIMGTVDAKDFLADKVASGGVVNTERAIMAGQLTRQVSVAEAVSRARQSVRDVLPGRPAVVGANGGIVHPMPLQPMFH